MRLLDFNVVVSGAGIGGYTAALRAGQMGFSLARAEGEDVLGGARLNVGWVPSKALLHASELFDLASHHFAELGIVIGPSKLKLATMMAKTNASIFSLRQGVEFLFKKYKVVLINDWAKVKAPGQIQAYGGSNCPCAHSSKTT